jgi:diguanylate cyclase (GGDEF)-like protein/PAS domain S-box-containing protein
MTLKTPALEAEASGGKEAPSPTLRLTARIGGRNALEKRLRILIKAVEQSPISILVTDSQGLIEYVNPKFSKLTGYTLADLVGQTPRVLKGGFLSPEFYQDLWRTIKAGEEWHGIFHNRTKDGSLVWELASISPIRDKAGVITHFVGVKEDITELKRLQDRTSYLAHHDPLTSLPNRLLFFDQLKHALTLARRRETPFAVLYLDLDGFKAVNDTLGHEAGDTLLAAMAARITDSVRSSDTVARMGGDEFTILLEDLGDRAHAAEVAQLILDKVAEPCLVGATVLTLGASLGISFFPGDGENADELLSAADAAMYAAKRGGKGGFRFASER